MARFTPEEIETAVKVMSYSKMVEKWLKNTLKAYNIDPKSPEGRKFCREKREQEARKLVRF